MKKIAMLFPGQGSQSVKMGEYLYNHYESARRIYEEASSVLGYDVAKLCIEGRLIRLIEFKNMQVAIVTTEVAMYQAFYETYHVLPTVAIGHSIGEYAALVCAGAIKLSDIIKIIVRRSELIERITAKRKSRMTVVDNISKDAILSIIDDLQVENSVYISCFNTQSQFTLSGLEEQLDTVETELVKAGAIISPLSFSPPIHSPLVEEIREEFFDFLSELVFNQFEFPILSSVTGEQLRSHEKLPKIISDQVVKPVLYQSTLSNILKLDLDCMVEMSQRPVLSKFNAGSDRKLPAFCFNEDSDRINLNDFMKS